MVNEVAVGGELRAFKVVYFDVFFKDRVRLLHFNLQLFLGPAQAAPRGESRACSETAASLK